MILDIPLKNPNVNKTLNEKEFNKLSKDTLVFFLSKMWLEKEIKDYKWNNINNASYLKLMEMIFKMKGNTKKTKETWLFATYKQIFLSKELDEQYDVIADIMLFMIENIQRKTWKTLNTTWKLFADSIISETMKDVYKKEIKITKENWKDIIKKFLELKDGDVFFDVKIKYDEIGDVFNRHIQKTIISYFKNNIWFFFSKQERRKHQKKHSDPNLISFSELGSMVAYFDENWKLLKENNSFSKLSQKEYLKEKKTEDYIKNFLTLLEENDILNDDDILEIRYFPKYHPQFLEELFEKENEIEFLKEFLVNTTIKTLKGIKEFNINNFKKKWIKTNKLENISEKYEKEFWKERQKEILSIFFEEMED